MAAEAEASGGLQFSPFVIFLIVSQLGFIVGFAACGQYGPTALPHEINGTIVASDLNHIYAMFQDVHVMIFIGFGFLMTFLKLYGYSAISINLLLAAYAVQWHLLLNGLFHMEKGKFHIGIFRIVLSEFNAGAVLISFGAILGKGSPLQYIVMVFIETIFFTANEYIFEKLIVSDVGGSMPLHAFGAYFGLAVARMFFNPDANDNDREGSVYHSDIFSMVGTVFLWIFWPSFNACLVSPDDARMRAVLNTYCSLASCTIIAFAVSSVVESKNRFNMVHVQNATLAGGVAIGASANLIVSIYGAMAVGAVAGALSTVGYEFLQPILNEKIKLHDTCGVNNLHGMPGILGGIVSIVVCFLAKESAYKSTFYDVFPAMNPSEAAKAEIGFMPGRTGTMQGVVQAIGLASSLGIAIVGGIVTGLILRMPTFQPVEGGDNHFMDAPYFLVPDEEDIDDGATLPIGGIAVSVSTTKVHPAMALKKQLSFHEPEVETPTPRDEMVSPV